VFDETLSPGLLVAFVDYVNKLFQPIQEFSGKLSILQRAASSLEKIFGLLDEDAAIGSGPVALDAPVGHLVLRDLRFAYRDGPAVLDGVDLELRPGEVVALVGRTGSGKSTIGRLLTRAYDGYEGSITLDGVELRELDLAAVRRAIGMVRQDVELFPGDVRFNLALGRDLPDQALRDAIAAAHADVAVDKLGGLEGRVAHHGANLSVGEAQLLSFARTLAHDPPLVILDEATASVDTLTEARIQAATELILARKTVLVIAHRLSTVVGADRIVVLDGGRVLETGSHAELLARGGAYAELFAQQFAPHDEAAAGR
jgi:ABC-type multidrug transport system fused ATPase/permease subunit